MGRDAGLVEQDGFLRIHTSGNKGGNHVPAIGRQFRRIIMHGDGVQIGQKEQAFGLFLQLYLVFDRAQIIAKVEITGRLDAGYNTHVYCPSCAACSAAFFFVSMAILSRSIAPVSHASTAYTKPPAQTRAVIAPTRSQMLPS